MNKRGKVCVLVSGGFDSAALLHLLLKSGCEVYPLYVRCGLYWEKAERHWLRRALAAAACPALKPLREARVDLPRVRRHWSVDGQGVPSARSAWDSVYLPGRNLLLVSIAAHYCVERGIPRIALALLRGNPFPDARPSALGRMESAIAAAYGRRIRVTSPFRRLRKSELVRRWKSIDFDLTFSCLKPRGFSHCQACSKCEERRRAIAGQ
jgi:7-cyano-7-deazaguanine synthase